MDMFGPLVDVMIEFAKIIVAMVVPALKLLAAVLHGIAATIREIREFFGGKTTTVKVDAGKPEGSRSALAQRIGGPESCGARGSRRPEAGVLAGAGHAI